MALNATVSSYVLCFLGDVTAFTVELEEQIAYPYIGSCSSWFSKLSWIVIDFSLK